MVNLWAVVIVILCCRTTRTFVHGGWTGAAGANSGAPTTGVPPSQPSAASNENVERTELATPATEPVESAAAAGVASAAAPPISASHPATASQSVATSRRQAEEQLSEESEEEEEELESRLSEAGTAVGAFACNLLTRIVIPVAVQELTQLYVLKLFKKLEAATSIRRFSRREIKKPVLFSDVIGCEEAKNEVMQLVAFLADSAKFKELAARPPRGVLLVGPPGTGKTLLARACAGEADVPFFYSCGSDFNGMYAGIGVMRVKRIFAQARAAKKGIIFIDEIDYVGKKRGDGQGQSLVVDRESTLNALLAEMDGFEKDDNILVIATTNRKDILDPALMRSGRFGDLVIDVEPPDVRGREFLFGKYLSPLKLALLDNSAEDAASAAKHSEPAVAVTTAAAAAAAGPVMAAESLGKVSSTANRDEASPTRGAGHRRQFWAARSGGGHGSRKEKEAKAAALQLELAEARNRTVHALAREMARLTPGCVGADVATICNKAALIAAAENATAVTMNHLSAAVDRVTEGLERRSAVMKPEERWRTAVHESGHAAAAWMLPQVEPVTKVSVVWRGSALGFTQILSSERVSRTKQDYLDSVCVLLAGRAAEEELVGSVSSGAVSDLDRATSVVHNMVSCYGFGDAVGLYVPSRASSGPETAGRLDREVQKLLQKQYQRARKLVRAHRAKVLELSRQLIDKETLHEGEIRAVFGERQQQQQHAGGFGGGLVGVQSIWERLFSRRWRLSPSSGGGRLNMASVHVGGDGVAPVIGDEPQRK